MYPFLICNKFKFQKTINCWMKNKKHWLSVFILTFEWILIWILFWNQEENFYSEKRSACQTRANKTLSEGFWMIPDASGEPIENAISLLSVWLIHFFTDFQKGGGIQLICSFLFFFLCLLPQNFGLSEPILIILFVLERWCSVVPFQFRSVLAI